MGLWQLIKVDQGVGYAGLRCRVFLGVIAFLGVYWLYGVLGVGGLEGSIGLGFRV